MRGRRRSWPKRGPASGIIGAPPELAGVDPELSDRIAVFTAVSLVLGALAGAWFLSVRDHASPALPPSTWLEVLLRTYTPTAALLAVKASGKSVREELGSYLRLRGRAIPHFLLAPLLAYLAVGVYMLLGLAAGLVDLSRPVKVVLERLAPQAGLAALEEVARLLLLFQLLLACIAALAINALLAESEESGWRGYMYGRLDSRPNVRGTLAIGAAWGL